jgi:hypothetical protein
MDVRDKFRVDQNDIRIYCSTNWGNHLSLKKDVDLVDFVKNLKCFAKLSYQFECQF